MVSLALDSGLLAMLNMVLGFFFYSNDTQETDIEILTSDLGDVRYTNQAVNGSYDASEMSSASPSDVTEAYHAYRLDWTKEATKFYIDGVLKASITDNVPSVPGFWMWNNWRYAFYIN